ncbi:MAG: class I SAM-dependent methyltransferase [Thermoplasmataceae archaeon]
MLKKASYSTLIKYGLRHPFSVYSLLQENRQFKKNSQHQFLVRDGIDSFDKFTDFLRSLFDLQSIELNCLTELKTLYKNSINKIRDFYGEEISLSVLSLEESMAIYFSIIRLKPETVIETGVSDGMSSLFVLSALQKNGRGNLYSIDFPEVGMPRLYGKEPGWIVDDSLRSQWSIIYGKSSEKLPFLLRDVKQVDVFLHDSEHSYSNMKFEFSTVLERMHPFFGPFR